MFSVSSLNLHVHVFMHCSLCLMHARPPLQIWSYMYSNGPLLGMPSYSISLILYYKYPVLISQYFSYCSTIKS